MTNDEFTKFIAKEGRRLYRDMPWRQDTSFYTVLVSEIMLQQTQVERVIPKFQAFTAHFPDLESLAQASLHDVLQLWVGLGYNRRAKYLLLAAQQACRDLPQTYETCLKLPGVGPNTAGAIMAYVYNQPVLFVETNIRTVYFYHWFTSKQQVSDEMIKQKLKQTIDQQNPRQFYWALMDYGGWLKKQGISNIQQSKHYSKQPPLHGSVRQVRGYIIARLTIEPANSESLRVQTSNDERFDLAIRGLMKDNLIRKQGPKYYIAS